MAANSQTLSRLSYFKALMGRFWIIPCSYMEDIMPYEPLMGKVMLLPAENREANSNYALTNCLRKLSSGRRLLISNK
jgi:hypothetical protein